LTVRRREPRVFFAWVLLSVSALGWPLSAFTFARGEPVTVLALSWIAIWIAALDVLFTAQVHEKQGHEKQDGSSGEARDGGVGMRSNYRDPPGRWGAATNAGGDVYFRLDVEARDVRGSVLVWHWCPALGLWRAASVGEHTLVSARPLHLEPSLLWSCCDKHGFLRDDRWTDV
jgi:hypothetical protein